MTIKVESRRPLALQVVKQRRDGAVGRRQEVVFQVGEGVAVRVPGLVVAQVDLHEADPGLDQPPGHQERPAKRVAAVAVEHGRFVLIGKERPAHPRFDQQRDGRLAVGVEPAEAGRPIQIAR